MKNFKLLLSTAVLFAVGSAFASTNTKVEDLWVRNGDGSFTVKAGDCLQSQEICSYHKIDPQGSNTDPANFSVAERGTYDPN